MYEEVSSRYYDVKELFSVRSEEINVETFSCYSSRARNVEAESIFLWFITSKIPLVVGKKGGKWSFPNVIVRNPFWSTQA